MKALKALIKVYEKKCLRWGKHYTLTNLSHALFLMSTEIPNEDFSQGYNIQNMLSFPCLIVMPTSSTVHPIKALFQAEVIFQYHIRK